MSETVDGRPAVAIKLVLLRHGQSVWNRDKRFTGWTDIGLSPRGVAQARAAGRLLATSGYRFDLCFTSCLERATETARLVLEAMGEADAAMTHAAALASVERKPKETSGRVSMQRSWRLNERHYGALQGLSRWEGVRRFGAKQMLVWQQEFTVAPPAVELTDARYPGNDPLYAAVEASSLPRAESLHDTLLRLLPFWRDAIAPALRAGQRVLVVAHRNSMRALIKHLDGVSDAGAMRMRVPTGRPLVYELDATLQPLRHYYLRERPRLWHWIPELLRPL